MAREYGKILFGMFPDGDFAALRAFDKFVYVVLIGQPSFNQAGVAPVNFRRLAKALSDGGVEPHRDQIMAAFARLEDARFIYFDLDTGELLIRSFMRSDGVVKQVAVLLAALRGVQQVESPKLRAALHAELLRMELPTRKGDSDRAKKFEAQLAAVYAEAVEFTSGGAPAEVDYADPGSEPFLTPPERVCNRVSERVSETLSPNRVSERVSETLGCGCGYQLPTDLSSSEHSFSQVSNAGARDENQAADAAERETRTTVEYPPLAPPATGDRPIPDDWQPSERERHVTAPAAGIRDVDSAAERFRLWAKARGVLRADWDAAFGQWLYDAKTKRSERQATGLSTTDQRVLDAERLKHLYDPHENDPANPRKAIQ